MVKIANFEEYERVKVSDFGFIVMAELQTTPTIHKSDCNLMGIDNYFKQRTDNYDSINLHWFSTYALAEKNFANIVSCTICKPES